MDRTIVLSLLVFAAPQQSPRNYELEVLKPVFNRYYEAGSDYYQSGWRGEAIWCFERATSLLPEAGNLERFVGLLRDFDNPIWKRKHWKSPRASAEEGFKRKQEACDLAYATALLKIGVHHAAKPDDKELDARAHEVFRRALDIVGGPYELDAAGRILAGKAGVIPDAFSKRMLAEDLILINGKRWLRDSMLRSLADVSAVHEARSDRCLVRTVTSGSDANHLLNLLEQAYPAYESALGKRSTTRPLGLFLFADRRSYEEWCKVSKNEARAKAAGFANCVEGFAVTFAQPGIEEISVHEAAHLFEFDVYAASMPSWYEEGLAESFGERHAMKLDAGRLTTRLRPTKAALAPILRDGKLALPLADVLNGDATDRIASGDGSAPAFYLESWALYSFLTDTKDPRFAARFEEWEGFALGSRWKRGAKSGAQEDATVLFYKVFGAVRGELESAFVAWASDPR